MRILILTSVLSILLIVGCRQKEETTARGQNKNMQESKTAETNLAVEEKLIYYTCPMESHKHIHSDTAGKCEECGMKLVQAVITREENAEFYGCPMPSHSHVREDKAGDCKECGMHLKPMRLKKENG